MNRSLDAVSFNVSAGAGRFLRGMKDNGTGLLKGLSCVWLSRPSPSGLVPRTLEQVVTALNPREFSELTAYARRKEKSIYAILKAALLECLEQHP